jgi:hypothetical protein
MNTPEIRLQIEKPPANGVYRWAEATKRQG